MYKATCRRSGETVVLKVYTLAAVCDLYKYQVRCLLGFEVKTLNPKPGLYKHQVRCFLLG